VPNQLKTKQQLEDLRVSLDEKINHVHYLERVCPSEVTELD